MICICVSSLSSTYPYPHQILINVRSITCKKCVAFSTNLHKWQKFYTTVSRGGRDKFQPCTQGLIEMSNFNTTTSLNHQQRRIFLESTYVVEALSPLCFSETWFLLETCCRQMGLAHIDTDGIGLRLFGHSLKVQTWQFTTNRRPFCVAKKCIIRPKASSL